LIKSKVKDTNTGKAITCKVSLV